VPHVRSDVRCFRSAGNGADIDAEQSNGNRDEKSAENFDEADIPAGLEE